MANESSISFSGALAVLFIALKLTGVIAWPWVWVLSPIWIPVLLALIVILAAVIFGDR
jgi:hypothetical protein